MADKKNLCAQIDIALHNRVTEEKDRLEMTTSQYIAQRLREYYEMKENGGKSDMANNGSITLAFQTPEELFQRIKRHLERESDRLGRRVTQREFVLDLIEEALSKAESEEPLPQENEDSVEQDAEMESELQEEVDEKEIPQPE